MNFNFSAIGTDFLWSLFNPGDFSTASGSLNCIFFALILGVFFISLGGLIYLRQRQQNLLNTISNTIKNETPETVALKREEINKIFAQSKYKPLRGAWSAFNSNLLVHEQDPDSPKQLRNPMFASDFFNQDSLKITVTNSRIFASIPAILTGLGVLGTFIGLLMGLTDLSMLQSVDFNVGADITSKNKLAEDLTSGIFGMIAGAATAFKTSVWGVSTSLVFNFYEKLRSSSLKKELNNTQNIVDSRYSHIDVNDYLQQIERHTRESSLVLSTLAEKIGDKMQESMALAGQTISQSLEESLTMILTPALNRLANTAQDQVQRASTESQGQLATLLSSFQESLSKAGQEQGNSINEATRAMQDATMAMADKFNEISHDLSQSMQGMRDEYMQSAKAIEESLRTQVASNTALVKNNNQETEKLFANISSLVNELAENFNKGNASQLNNNQQIIAALKQLTNSFEQLGKANSQSSSKLQEAANSLNQSSQNFHKVASGINGTLQNMSNTVSRAIQSANEISQANKSSVNLISESAQKLQATLNSMTELNKALSNSANLSQQSFATLSEQFNGMMQTMRQQTNEFIHGLSAQMEDYHNTLSTNMEEYHRIMTNNLQSRMETWNKETQIYTSTMTDAINSLSLFVDSLENHNKHK